MKETKEIVRHKKQLNVNIEPYLLTKMERLIESKEFSGYSGLASIAIAQFIERYEMQKTGVSKLADAQTRT